MFSPRLAGENVVGSIAKVKVNGKKILSVEAFFYGKNRRNVEAENLIYFSSSSATW